MSTQTPLLIALVALTVPAARGLAAPSVTTTQVTAVAVDLGTAVVDTPGAERAPGAFLVHDADGDGAVSVPDEIVGGVEALAALDHNRDGRIDGADPAFDRLMLMDRARMTDAPSSLADVGVDSIRMLPRRVVDGVPEPTTAVFLRRAGPGGTLTEVTVDPATLGDVRRTPVRLDPLTLVVPRRADAPVDPSPERAGAPDARVMLVPVAITVDEKRAPGKDPRK